MPATQTPQTPEADRFACLMDVPDPPAHPLGRRRYWDDTVQEAVAELRRRLSSSDEGTVTMALLAIVKLETTRMRHGRTVSGTQVSNVEDDDWRDPLPKLAPLDVALPSKQPTSSPALQSRAEPPSPGAGSDAPPVTDAPQSHGPVLEVQAPSAGGTTPPVPTTPVVARSASERRPLAERATTTTPPPPATLYTEPKRTFSDRDDDWTRDPARNEPTADWEPGPTRAEADAAYDAVVERQREGLIESCGLYPEDEYPNNPDYFRFKADPRPHPAELRWLEWRFGITAPPPAGIG